MKPSTPLESLRRRWWLVVVFAVLGAVLGAIPRPAEVEETATTFRATHTMLASAADATGIAPSQVQLFATVGDVPKRVADGLGYDGSPAELAQQVTVDYDLNTGALTFRTQQETAAQAEAVADAFAEETSSYLTERQDAAYEERAAASRQRVNTLEAELTDLSEQAAADPENALVAAQRDAVSVQYGLAFEQNRDLEADTSRLTFTTLESAQAIPEVDRGLSTPTSRSSRALMGMVAGSVVGVLVAILLGRLDRKIRTRDQAEEIIGMRSRVTIPKVRRTVGGVVVRSDEHGALPDSYRTLRNLVTFVQSGLPPKAGGYVTLVVSPGPGDGKTSVSANLAAALSESGERTIAADGDFRRPQLSKALTGHPPPYSPLQAEDLRIVDVRHLIGSTSDNRVKIVDMTGFEGAPDEMVRILRDRVDDLTEVADQVVIDTSPVGATAEVLDLIPYADVIVLVARVGHTVSQAAARTATILSDIADAPVLFVLHGLKADKSTYYEYNDDRRREMQPPAGNTEQPELESID